MQTFNAEITGRPYRIEVKDSETAQPRDIAKALGRAFAPTTFEDYARSVLTRAAELQRAKEGAAS